MREKYIKGSITASANEMCPLERDKRPAWKRTARVVRGPDCNEQASRLATTIKLIAQRKFQDGWRPPVDISPQIYPLRIQGREGDRRPDKLVSSEFHGALSRP